MSIAITVKPGSSFRISLGAQNVRSAKISVTGLTAGASNTIAHGLPYIPRMIDMNPISATAGTWQQNQAADATNIYVLVGSNGPTAGDIDVTE